MKINQDEKIIDRLLNKGVEEILPSKEELRKLLLSGKRIKVYQGFDPTASSLHIGHTVAMRKLEDFRQLGHEVFFLIGDFTAMIGDPSDKMSARQKLTREQVKENLKLYKEQAQKIIDLDNQENPIKIVYNYDWLSKLTFEDIVELCSHFTVQQMLKRDMFQKRLEQNSPIYLNEFLYPIMQGYDSVNLEVDVEVCGNDQMFNSLAGRHLSKQLLKKDKFVLTGKLLTTTDGAKMGKSENNMISFLDRSNDVYGKVMALPDEAILNGFELLTNKELEEIEKYKQLLENTNTNPMDLKKELAFEVTKTMHSEKEAKIAQEYWEKVRQGWVQGTDTSHSERGIYLEGALPLLEEISIKKQEYNILDLIKESGLVESKSAARRLVEQSAVSVNNEKVKDINFVIKSEEPVVIKVGKKIAKITFT